MGLTIRTEGATEAIRELRLLDERFNAPLGPLLTTLTQVMSEAFRDHISFGPPAGIVWPPLHPVTLAIRRRHGHGGKPTLYRRGDLFESIRPIAQGPDYTEVGTTLDAYARTVQEGGEIDTGGHRRTVAARPYVILSDSEIDDLAGLALDWFTGADPGPGGGTARA